MQKQKMYLKDIAYEKIKEKVVLGEINSSNYLSENELVRMLNMSRTPIRAALQRLENEGYLKVFPNLGIKIEDLSIKDALNLHEYRNVIECFSLKKLLNSSQANAYCELLEVNINKQKEAISKYDITAFMKLDTELHEIIVSAFARTAPYSTNVPV
ncbi:GntR family transcriptional regulator OS=Ureibacillus acetophenoni OX=614649 GN=SAMN05877842_102529 PE=4 SV=1 [Ureibacillus acetophenoni]